MIHEEEKVLVDGISLPDTRTSTAMRTESLVRKGLHGSKTFWNVHGECFVQVHVTNITTTDGRIRKTNLGVKICT